MIIAHVMQYLCVRNQNNKAMNTFNKTFVINDDVINTINSLSEEDRISISAAIAGEMICGRSVENNLTSMQRIIFSIIKSSVKRSTDAYTKREALSA